MQLRLIIAGAALIVAFSTGFFIKAKLDSGEIEKLKGELKAATLRADVAEASSKELGKAVEEWKTKAKEQADRVTQAEAQAAKVQLVWRDRIVYREPPPAAPGDPCPERKALEWLSTEYQALSQAFVSSPQPVPPPAP